MDLLMEHLGKGLWLAIMLSMPAVLFAATIGLVVGILQAVTQVQEQTIAAAPKILGVFLLIIFTGGLMMNVLNDYSREAIYLAFNEIPQTGPFLAPPLPKSPQQQAMHQFFYQQVRASNTGKPKVASQRSFGSGASNAGGQGVPLTQTSSTPKTDIIKRLQGYKP
jgi:flagellar biosynthesis protein FliQ